MAVAALTRTRGSGARIALLTIVASAVAIAAYGATLIPGTLGSEHIQPAFLGTVAHKPVFAVGDRAPLSFGALQVIDSRVAVGLTNQQLGGMSHGISGLIGARTAQLQVTIEMTNSTYAAAPWTAADFRVEGARTGREFAAVGGTKESGALAPGSSIDFSLNYVVPRNGDHYTLRMRDGNSSVRVHLIQVGKAPPGTAGLDHSHAKNIAAPKKREGTKQ
jgi:hypothetical protein